MKFVSIVLVVLLMASCSSDDDSSAFVGEWVLDVFKLSCAGGNITLNVNAMDGCVEQEETQVCFTVMIDADGSGRLTSVIDGFTDTNSFTYTENGNSINVCDSANDCATFTLTGDLLSFTSTEDDCVETYTLRKAG